MSQEWLKQLAELSNDKNCASGPSRCRRPSQAPSARPPAGSAAWWRRLRLLLRWLFLFALVEAVAMFVVADSQA
jgi:hypothetical protein